MRIRSSVAGPILTAVIILAGPGLLAGESPPADATPVAQTKAAEKATPVPATDETKATPAPPPTPANVNYGMPKRKPIKPAAGRKAACEGGLVVDDGHLETGYGYTPSAERVTYLMEVDSADLPSRRIESVCVCWMQSRKHDTEIDYEVVFFQRAAGMPAEEPYKKVAAKATGVPLTKEEGGRFYTVDLSEAGVVVPDGMSYVGVTWEPNKDTFFFICADHSPATEKVGVLFMEPGRPWVDVRRSGDPMFTHHKAMMLRLTAAGPETETEAEAEAGAEAGAAAATGAGGG